MASTRTHVGAPRGSATANRLVQKPPFRIPQIEALWGSTVHYLHIVRDVHETADLMRRNRFEFLHHGRA